MPAGTTRRRVALDRRSLIAQGWTIARRRVAHGRPRGRRARLACPARPPVVRGGVVAYATDVKHSLLGVDADLLDARGRRAIPTSRGRWREGVRERCGRRAAGDVGIATTGVAGPDPQDGQPVGTVHIAVVDADGTARRRRSSSPAPREQIRAEATVARALALVPRGNSDESRAAGTDRVSCSVTFGDSHPFHSARD